MADAEIRQFGGIALVIGAAKQSPFLNPNDINSAFFLAMGVEPSCFLAVTKKLVSRVL